MQNLLAEEYFPGSIGGRRVVFASLTLLCFLAGALIALEPRAAVFLAVVSVLAGLVAFRPMVVQRWALLGLLGGAMIMAYGFANIGFQSGLAPVPLTEILLIPLVIVALADPRFRPPAANMIPLFLFFLLVMVRLLFDYPTYRSFAVRDATTAIEACMLVVGYRWLARENLSTWIRRLSIIFFLVLAYGAFYPWRSWLSSIGPTVGLQRDVSLFGKFVGIEPTVAAATLFFAIHSRGSRRLLVVIWGLLLVAILQARGLYVTLIPALAIMGFLLRRPGRVVAIGVAGLVAGALVLSFLAAQGIQGRLGPLSKDFYSAQIGTLFGGQGPGSQTIRDRAEWAKRTIEYVGRSPASLAVGVGLGPDLTFGFRGPGARIVRKPHDDYLEIFARTGFLGLLLFLWLIGAALVPIWKRARADRGDAGRFCAWVVASSVVYLGVAATQPTLAFPYGTIPMFFLLGAGLAVARKRSPASLAAASVVPSALNR